MPPKASSSKSAASNKSNNNNSSSNSSGSDQSKFLTRARSEQEYMDALLREVSSVPEREIPPAETAGPAAEGQASTSGQQQPMQASRGYSSDMSTKVMIAKTIRAAMADVRPGS